MEDRNEAASAATGMEPGSRFIARRRLERLAERVRDEGLVPRVVLGTAALGGRAWEQEVGAALAALVAGAAIAGFDRAVVRRVQRPGYRPEGLEVVLVLPMPLGGVCDDVLECVEQAEDGQRIDLASLRAWAHGIGAMDEPSLARAAAAGGIDFKEAPPTTAEPHATVDEVAMALGLVLDGQGKGWKVPDEKELAGMAQADLDAVLDWASLVHLRASDNDDVEVPPMPAALVRVLEVLGWTVPKVFLDGKPALDPEAEADRLEKEHQEQLDEEEAERERAEAQREAGPGAALPEDVPPTVTHEGKSLGQVVQETLEAHGEGEGALPRADAPEAPPEP